MKKIHLSNSATRIIQVGFLSLLFFQTACVKDIDVDLSQKFSISGRIVDDKTGDPIAAGGTIKVDGFKAPVGLLDPTYKQNLGRSNIYPGGVFNFSFKEWSQATEYQFGFTYDNNSYVNLGTTYLNLLQLNASLFATGHHDVEIRAVKMAKLRVNFRNVAPFNTADRVQIILPGATENILFGYLFPQFENLQFCTHDPVTGEITGGSNASGILNCTVPSDQKFSIKWKTTKNNIEQTFQDSIQCPRDVVTTFNLNY